MRYLRQILVPEIGVVGQRGIEASTAAVSGASLAHEVACLYALGAGFHAVSPAEPVRFDVDALAPVTVATSPSARQVLAGARVALAEIRRAIAGGATEAA